TLNVEDDVGHVLDDAGDRADLVLHALDLDLRDGAALEAGQQDAAQAVADGDAEAALERLGDELAVGVGERRAVTVYAVGQFQTTPSDTHVQRSPSKRGRSSTRPRHSLPRAEFDDEL